MQQILHKVQSDAVLESEAAMYVETISKVLLVLVEHHSVVLFGGVFCDARARYFGVQYRVEQVRLPLIVSCAHIKDHHRHAM